MASVLVSSERRGGRNNKYNANKCMAMHDMASSGARDALTRYEVIPVVRTPILSHIDLASNTSYHFAASRMVSHGCRLTMAGTVCAFWLTYTIVSLASI